MNYCDFNNSIYILDFPADIGRKPALPARGSGQRLHACESHTPVRAGNTRTLANEAANGTTWRRL